MDGLPVSEKKVLMLPFSVCSAFKRPSGYTVRRHNGETHVDAMLEAVELHRLAGVAYSSGAVRAQKAAR
jgi:hypothetical protein